MLANIAKKILPDGTRQMVSDFYYEQKLFKAARAIAMVKGPSEVLDEKHFEPLFYQFPVGDPVMYDAVSIRERGIQRAEDLIGIMHNYTRTSYNNILELGAGDGMVSSSLQERGKQVTAIEFRDDDFDQRAQESGVNLMKMDAAELQFEDHSFDFVFSYNCFEHFPDPQKVFEESLRVLKPGGLMFIHFAPLYHSPYGAHAYNNVGIPYCQFLFDKHFLNKWINTHADEKFNIDATLNRWHIDQFRKLFKQTYWDKCKIGYYKEFRSPYFLDLVIKHPQCFKNKIMSMDDLIISEIKAVFVKQ